MFYNSETFIIVYFSSLINDYSIDICLVPQNCHLAKYCAIRDELDVTHGELKIKANFVIDHIKPFIQIACIQVLFSSIELIKDYRQLVLQLFNRFKYNFIAYDNTVTNRNEIINSKR